MLTLIYQERVSKAYRLCTRYARKVRSSYSGNGADGGGYPPFPKSSQPRFKEMQEAEAIVDDLLRKYPDNSKVPEI